MRRNTLFAGSKDCMHAIDSLKRAAPAARISLVAPRKSRIHEIRTACALQKVSPVSRQIAQLRGCSRENRVSQQRIPLSNQGMISRITVAGQRSQTQSAIRQSLDFRQRQAIDVDQSGGPLNTVFHQVDKICSARQKFSMI